MTPRIDPECRDDNESVFDAVERGASWPGRLHACRDGHAATVVVVQGPVERPGRFARRCVARLNELHRAGRPSHAVIAIGRETDPETRTSRATIARALAKAMTARLRASLIFATPDSLADGTLHEVMALVESLMEVGNAGLAVRIVAGQRGARRSIAALRHALTEALHVEVS